MDPFKSEEQRIKEHMTRWLEDIDSAVKGVRDYMKQITLASKFMVDEFDTRVLAASLELVPSSREPVVYDFIVTAIAPNAAVVPSVTDVDVDFSATTVVAAAITATLPNSAGATTYITGFEVTGLGATAATVIAVTIVNISGGTKTYYLAIPAGVGVEINRLQVEFTRPIPTTNPATSILVQVPSFGAGNTNAAVTAHGFKRTTVAPVGGGGGTLLLGRRRITIPVGITAFPVQMRLYENDQRILMTGTPEAPGAASALFFEMTGHEFPHVTY